MSERPTVDEVRAAQERLHGIARVTPVYPSETLSRLAGRPVLLKAENLQRTGAFKIRGAYNTIAQLAAAEREAAGEPPIGLSIVVNTGDDLELHGLSI